MKKNNNNIKTFIQFNEGNDHDFLDPKLWSKMKSVMDDIDYDMLKYEIGSSYYDEDDDDFEDELDYYESHTHFTEDDLIEEVTSRIRMGLNIKDIDKYRQRIENYIEKYI